MDQIGGKAGIATGSLPPPRPSSTLLRVSVQTAAASDLGGWEKIKARGLGHALVHVETGFQLLALFPA